MHKMGFIEELSWRKMIHDFTPGIKEHLAQEMRCGYIGFDPTAKSLGIGNYIQIMMLNFFQRAGHKPMVVMGGATGAIGDPSGKDSERDLKSIEELHQNLELQRKQFHRLLNFDLPANSAVLVNNMDFYKDLRVIDFLRDVGKNATINYMLSKESVKRRLDSGISYTEFSYQLLQAYDFYCMYKKYHCTVQMGGSDQWGNIVAGSDYINKTIPNAKVFAITSPLLINSTGKKFGKTEQGNIFLDPTMTSPYKFYQFWLNTNDSDLPQLFRYFSFKSKEEIEALEKINDPRELKNILAEELTERIHGPVAYRNVLEVTQLIFNKDLSRDSILKMPRETLEAVSAEISTFKLGKEWLNRDLTVTQLLAEATNCFPSNSEVRRAILGNALSINKEKIVNINHPILRSHFLHDIFLFVENGKKNKYIIMLE